MATLSQINSQAWQLSKAAIGEVVQGIDDVRQCIDNILYTQKGSQCFDPNFGVDLLAYIDRPVTLVANLCREIQEQITRYEKRVEILTIKSTVEASGYVTISVTWQLGTLTGQNTVRYGTSS